MPPRLILILNIRHLPKFLPQIMTGRALDRSPRAINVGFDSSGDMPAGETLHLRLAALDDWDGEQVFVDLLVEIEVVTDHFLGFVVGGVGGVAFLPQEFPGAEEGGGVLEFPTDDVAPLVQTRWEDHDGSESISYTGGT